MAEPRRVKQDSLIFDRQGDTTVLRPQAQPTEAFVRQAPPTKSGMWDVAESLASVNPRIQRWIDDKVREGNVEDMRDAESKAMLSEAASWQEAVDKGEVSVGASPLYQRVFQETIGKRDGLSKAQAEVWQAWVSPDNADRNSQDPKVIAGFFDKYKKKFFEGQSDDYVRGFSPAFFQVQQQLTQRIIAENVQAMEQKGKDALGQLFMERIMAGQAAGKAPAQIAAELTDDSLPQQFVGLKGKDVNDIAAKALIAVAQKTGDSSVLRIGYADRPDLRNPGGTVKGVFTIPQYTLMADSAQTNILAKQNQQATAARLAEDRAEKAAGKAFMVEMMEKKAADPNFQPSAEDLVRGRKLGVSPVAVRAEVEATRKITASPDPAQFLTLASDYVRMLQMGQDTTEAIQRLTPFLTPTQQLSLLKESSTSLQNIVSGETYTTQKKTFQALVDPVLKKLDPFEAQDLSRRLLMELDGYTTSAFLKMAEDGKGYIDVQKLNAQIKEKANEMVERVRSSDANGLTPGNEVQPPAPGAKPGPNGKPATPGKGASGQTPTANPNSVTNAIPMDRIVPTSSAAEGYKFPYLTRDIGNGRSVRMQWELQGEVIPSMGEINLLRTQPMRLNAEGSPVWKRFDEQYGKGASHFFITNSPREIGVFFDHQRAARKSAYDETMKRVRSSNAPNQVP